LAAEIIDKRRIDFARNRSTPFVESGGMRAATICSANAMGWVARAAGSG
jgi:hypothetical protein